MRFLLFNIVVGAALLYLYKGGDLDMALFAGPSAAPAQTRIASNPSANNPQPGHARDVITAPSEAAPKPLPAQKDPVVAEVPPQAGDAVPPAAEPGQLAPIKDTVHVARRTPKKPVDTELPAAADPAVLRRRAEVLGTDVNQPRPAPLSLREGTTLMSRSDRRRSLDALAEEMEMLFLDQTGG